MIYNQVIMETNELESDVQFLERVLADMMPLDEWHLDVDKQGFCVVYLKDARFIISAMELKNARKEAQLQFVIRNRVNHHKKQSVKDKKYIFIGDADALRFIQTKYDLILNGFYQEGDKLELHPISIKILESLDTHEKIALKTLGLWYRVEINNETSNEQDTNTV